MNLDHVGEAGQLRLKESRVLIVGVGGLGCPVALYLAAAGVGTLGLIDFDEVDISNLQRQVLYGSNSIGKAKVEAAEARLHDLNPGVKLEIYRERLSLENSLNLFSKYDVIVDGADNFATRYLVNDASFFSGKPLVSASILGFEGQLAVFNLPNGPCFRCLYPEPPPAGTVPSCAEAGVLGAVPGVFGCLQSNEVLKLLLKIGEQGPSLVILDLLNLDFSKILVSRASDCPLCGEKPTITVLNEIHFVCQIPTRNDFDELDEISALDLAEVLKKGGHQIVDVRQAHERRLGAIEPSLHIPLSKLEEGESWERLSQETPLIVYCQSGIRSAKAAKILREKGFLVKSLAGGILSWEKFDSRR